MVIMVGNIRLYERLGYKIFKEEFVREYIVVYLEEEFCDNGLELPQDIKKRLE